MTDDPDVTGDATRDADDLVDPADLDRVGRALAGLDFLRPDAIPAAEVAATPMPDDVWQRLQGALADEREAASDATVVPMAPRRSRAARWAGGLVAASVAVLAVSVGVTAFRGGGSGGGEVVAGEVIVASAMSVPESLTKTGPSAASAPSAAPEAGAAAGTDVLTAPGQLSFAGMVPPALRLIGSDTDYTERGLRSQVSTVLDDLGLMPDADAPVAMEQAPETVVMADMETAGFLSSAERLRDCITRLTQADDSTALMVDMSTYEGQDAGVVVAPDYPAAVSEPDMTELEVWVVDPECTKPMKALRIQLAR